MDIFDLMARVSLDQQRRWEALTQGGGKKPERPEPIADADELKRLAEAHRKDARFRAKDIAEMTIPQLLKLYSSSGGGDDAATEEFERRGDAARDELIRLLDNIPSSELARREGPGPMTGAMMEVLTDSFPSKPVYQALARLDSRLPGYPIRNMALLKAKLNGQHNDKWLARNHGKSGAEQSLHLEELLLANARPVHRATFLVETARYALEAVEEARKSKNRKREAANRAKATAYAQKILAMSPAAQKSADAAYWAHQTLGMIALYQAKNARAKQHLLASANALPVWLADAPALPPDWSLAEELLKQGEREAVGAFLESLETAAAKLKARSKNQALLKRWRKAVETGGSVNFMEWFLRRR